MASSPAANSPPVRAWRHLRGAFVAFHVIAVTVGALPATNHALKRSAWKDPTVQAEISAWADRLGTDRETLTSQLWDLALGWYRLRNTLLTPFRPYLDHGHLDQGWQMFIAPHTWPTRLRIEEQRGGVEWTALYEEVSPTATWMAPTLRVERLRAAIFRWGWASYADAYHIGCTALARRRFEESPETTRVRCRFSKVETPSAAEVIAGDEPELRWVFPFVVER
jgi:hypothetical protein